MVEMNWIRESWGRHLLEENSFSISQTNEKKQMEDLSGRSGACYQLLNP